MDWSTLHAGRISQQEIRQHVGSPDWQRLRESLKGTSLQFKYQRLQRYLIEHDNSREAQVQVTNYINALKRGGLIRKGV